MSSLFLRRTVLLALPRWIRFVSTGRPLPPLNPPTDLPPLSDLTEDDSERVAKMAAGTTEFLAQLEAVRRDMEAAAAESAEALAPPAEEPPSSSKQRIQQSSSQQRPHKVPPHLAKPKRFVKSLEESIPSDLRFVHLSALNTNPGEFGGESAAGDAATAAATATAAGHLTCSLTNQCDVFYHTASCGLSWIDVRGRPNDNTIGSDADFVAAARSVLRHHGVPKHFIAELSNSFALPQTLRHNDHTFCVVCRFALRDNERLATSFQPDEIAFPTANANGSSVASTPYRKVGVTLSRACVTGAAPRREIQERLEKELHEARRGGSGRGGRQMEKSAEGSESLQDLTGRLTVIVLKKQNKVITIHRQRMPALLAMRRQWTEQFRCKSLEDLVIHVVRACASSFLDAARDKHFAVDALEAMLFDEDKSNFREHGVVIQKLHGLNRGASVFSRIMHPMDRTMRDVLRLLGTAETDPRASDALQTINRGYHTCEELREQIMSLLQLHFSVVSYQIEDLMRVMTIFSTICTPMAFLTAVAGMNFDLPFFSEGTFGPSITAGAMILSAGLTVMWLRRRGFW